MSGTDSNSDLSSLPSDALASSSAPRSLTGGALSDKPLISLENQKVKKVLPVVEGGEFCNPLENNEKIDFLPSSDDLAAVEDWLSRECFFDWFQFSLVNEHGLAECDAGSEAERILFRSAVSFFVDRRLLAGTPGRGAGVYRARLPFVRRLGDRESVGSLAFHAVTGSSPNVTISGADGLCATLAPAAQKEFTGARLSRADVAFDISHPDAFAALVRVSEALKASRDMQSRKKVGAKPLRFTVMDSGEQGKTAYLGEKGAEVSVKFYLKDLERVHDGKKKREDADFDPNLVRVEFTFRPDSKSKKGMFALAPHQFVLGKLFSRDFVQRLFHELTGKTCKLKPVKVRREVSDPSLERAFVNGISQYGPTFLKLAARQLFEESPSHWGAELEPVGRLEHEPYRLLQPLSGFVLSPDVLLGRTLTLIGREMISGLLSVPQVMSDLGIDRVLDPTDYADMLVSRGVDLSDVYEDQIREAVSSCDKWALGLVPVSEES